MNAILDEKIEEVDLDKNPILKEINMSDEKVEILDVKAKINDKITCDIEMQMIAHENLVERIMFYWSKLYISNINKGDDYTKLEKCIEILISNFKLRNLKEIVN